jgi:two-component system, OmpR family, phosphate regulon sensor histidine kinase PhoR
VSVKSAVRRSIEAVQTIAADKNLELVNHVADDLLCLADETALDQIVVNLIENATKYTPEGGHIEARATRRGEMIRVEIRDDGPGVKAKYRERIFERFYRVDKGRSREMGGTGLGLSITKHLVENMGGEIGVEPNSPEGSVFWFTLPEATAESISRTRLSKSAKSSRPGSSFSPQRTVVSRNG